MGDCKAMCEWYEGYIKQLGSEALQLREFSNLGARFSNRTFGNFEKNRDPKAFNACNTYANRLDLFPAQSRAEVNRENSNKRETEQYRNGLIICGGYGSGKTHLAAAIANSLIDMGVAVLFGTFSEHLEHIKEEFDNDGKHKYLQMMKDTAVLVLDDLGKEKKTEWSQQILFDVVNYRYEHMLPIVITTNIDPKDFGTYVGGAVYSRFCEMCSAIETTGGDRRKGQ